MLLPLDDHVQIKMDIREQIQQTFFDNETPVMQYITLGCIQ